MYLQQSFKFRTWFNCEQIGNVMLTIGVETGDKFLECPWVSSTFLFDEIQQLQYFIIVRLIVVFDRIPLSVGDEMFTEKFTQQSVVDINGPFKHSSVPLKQRPHSYKIHDTVNIYEFIGVDLHVLVFNNTKLNKNVTFYEIPEIYNRKLEVSSGFLEGLLHGKAICHVNSNVILQG